MCWFCLVLSGVELIFLIAAGIGLWVRFVLITQGCFQYCWAVLTQHQDLFGSSPPQQWGGAQGIGRASQDPEWDTGYSTPFDAHHVELGEEEGRSGTLGAMVFVFSSHQSLWWSSPGNGWTPACPWEVENEFLDSLLVYVAFVLPFKLFFINPWIFLLLPFQFSPTSHCGGQWVSGCVQLSCWMG